MLLHELRSTTATAHARLERDLPLMDPALTIADYVALLSRFQRYYRAWEHEAGPWLHAAVPALWPQRSKLAWLEEDLQCLGGPAAPARFPDTVRLPRLSSTAEALGSLYVLEGSTLGGQLIARHLSKQLGVSQGRGASFFTAYGPETSARWQEFRTLLMTFSSPQNDPLMVAAALETFETMHSCLCAAAGCGA